MGLVPESTGEYAMDCPSTQPYHAALAAFSSLNQQRLLPYLTQLAAQRYAPATLQAIPRTLTGFLRALPPERHAIVAADLTQTTSHDITVFITVGQTAGLAPSTLNTKLSILAKVFAHLCDEGLMLRQPVRWRQHHLVVPQGLPKAIPDADLVAFFQGIDSLRDRLLFLLMLRCGLRVSEACALPWDAVDLQARTVRINRGKGQVDRLVYFLADVAQAFQRWQRHHAPGVYVFPSPQRRRPHLFRSMVNRLMDQYLAAAGLTTHYSPHCLRHTFATHLLNAGVPLEVLKELMGHQSLHQTLRYAQLYDTTKRQQYDQAMVTITQRQALGGH
jgi:site-specific recombinase XerD